MKQKFKSFIGGLILDYKPGLILLRILTFGLINLFILINPVNTQIHKILQFTKEIVKIYLLLSAVLTSC